MFYDCTKTIHLKTALFFRSSRLGPRVGESLGRQSFCEQIGGWKSTRIPIERLSQPSWALPEPTSRIRIFVCRGGTLLADYIGIPIQTENRTPPTNTAQQILKDLVHFGVPIMCADLPNLSIQIFPSLLRIFPHPPPRSPAVSLKNQAKEQRVPPLQTPCQHLLRGVQMGFLSSHRGLFLGTIEAILIP